MLNSLATAACCAVLSTVLAPHAPATIHPPHTIAHTIQQPPEDDEDSREAGWKRREILQIKDGRASSSRDADYDTEMIVIPVLVLMAVIGLLRLSDF